MTTIFLLLQGNIEFNIAGPLSVKMQYFYALIVITSLYLYLFRLGTDKIMK